MPAIYALDGSPRFPQVEPGAAFWLRNPVPRAIQLEEVRRELDGIAEFDEAGSNAEMDDLKRVGQLAKRAYRAPAFGQSDSSAFLRRRAFILRPAPANKTQPAPTPVFPPPGAVHNRRTDIAAPFLLNGAELGRLFENETPGLWHRHVLNIPLDPTIPDGPGRALSPPRHALIWAALDVAISSALQAAWYFKWFSLEGRRISFRRRPWEADNKLPVVYDDNLAYDATGNIIAGSPRRDPPNGPGTPRHPAYPSGHSTYSAAASVVLGCLFPDYRGSFNRLANDIGRARLWAGVHWIQDHTTGQTIGSTIGRLVIAQLNESGIAVRPAPIRPLPGPAEFRQLERDFYGRARDGLRCGNGKRKGEDFCRGVANLVAGPDGAMNPGAMFKGEGSRTVRGSEDKDAPDDPLPPETEEERNTVLDSDWPAQLDELIAFASATQNTP